MDKVGLIFTTFNDKELLEKYLDSLWTTEYPFDLVVVDCNSTDGSKNFFRSWNLDTVLKMGPMQSCTVLEHDEYISLPQALNQGISECLLPPPAPVFKLNSGRKPIDYIGWWHSDMKVTDPKWLGNLVEYLKTHPDVGRVASSNLRDGVKEERAGNELPCLWTRKLLEDLKATDGYYFDECYFELTYEDWDFLRRSINLGYKCMITPTSVVWHDGMGTRSKRDHGDAHRRNAAYYFKKWGTYDPPV